MKNVLIFVTGAAIGSVVTWKLIERKYKDLADEEIQSVIDTFKNRKETVIKPVEKIEENIEHQSYNEITDKYKDLSSDDEEDYKVELENEEDHIIPYTIPPEEFGEKDNYGTKTLTYYADGVLTDEIDTPIEDADTMIGPFALDKFGEYEDDAVYVRDEDNEMDYEILKSEKTFNEINEGRS